MNLSFSSHRALASAGRLLCLSLLALPIGCGDSGDSGDTSDAGSMSNTDSGMDMTDGMAMGDGGMNMDGMAPALCTDEPTSIDDVHGMGSSNVLMAKVVSADPNPPQMDANNWVFEITTMDGTKVTDATFSNVRTWMYVHNHGGTYAPQVTQDTTDSSQYKFDNVYFQMVGPWYVEFDVSSPTAGDDSFSLPICVGQ